MSTFTTNLNIQLIGTGEQAGTWGSTTNNNFQYVFEEAIVGRTTVSFSDANVTLTATAASTDQQYRNVYLNCTGTNTAQRSLIVPTVNKNYIVENNTTGGFAILVTTSGGTGIVVPNGFKAALYVDGTNVVTAFNWLSALTTTTATIGTLTLTNALTTANGGTGLTSFTANGVVYASSTSALATGSALVFDGTNLGLGVTPSAWGGPFKAIQSGNGNSAIGFQTNANVMRLFVNNFYNGTNYVYTGSAAASQYTCNSDGSFNWQIAASGTAGNAISFTQAMTLDASGKLVLGGTSTDGIITLGSTSYGTGSIYQSTKNNGGTFYYGIESSVAASIVNGSSAYASLLFTQGATSLQFGTNNNIRATIDSSGNLGLGVTPSAWFSTYKALQIGAVTSLFNDGGTTSRLSNNAIVNAGGNFAYISTAAASFYQQGGGQHAWYYAASGTAGATATFTQAMTLDASGNLIVGTTSAYLTSILSLQSANSNNFRLTQNILNTAATSTTRNANTIIRMSSNASGADACFQVTDNVTNNYFFGGNNGGAYVVANSGGVRLSNGGTSWASDSDERLKDIIEPITDAVKKVSTLRAVIGKYKTDEEGTRRSFLIAQDVQAVLPEAVFDEQGTLMLAYTETIPLLVAAIKELNAKVTALEAQLAVK